MFRVLLGIALVVCGCGSDSEGDHAIDGGNGGDNGGRADTGLPPSCETVIRRFLPPITS